jgi:hypothetical protein
MACRQLIFQNVEKRKQELFMEYGILGLLVFIADIYAIFNIFSSRVSVGAKLLWTLLVLILPVVGFIIWFIAGPRGSAAKV